LRFAFPDGRGFLGHRNHSVAVHENKVVGTAILRYGLERARARGLRTYGLDVADNNPRAQKLYERFGMTVVSVRPLSDRDAFAGLPRLRRMEMPV
jgi:RimJ/RimL family protein N-acetyltransferase